MFRKAAVLTFVLASTAQAQTDPTLWKALKFRHIGPEGNRVTSVSGVVGDPMTFYAGAASGGIWKTSDGGIHWTPIFDSVPVSSVGSLAVAPSDPNIVWAGTGEPFIRSNISIGWGVYRSTDAGKTWQKMGLDLTGRIGRIAIDPRNPDNVLVAALGHAYGPQPERGVYRTTDGGKTWAKTLFVNDSTGAIDVLIDPSNPRIAYAGTWQIEIHTWGRRSGGAGSGIWKSTDGGATWTRLTKGLPTTQFGKVGLAIAHSNPSRVYALIETSDGVKLPGVDTDSGELWRSDDGGDNWTLVSHDRELAGRTQYYSRMAVAPDNDLEAYFLTSSFVKTLDGGRSLVDLPGAEIPGGDHHDIWIDPTNARSMAVSHDGGISISANRGKTWNQIQLPIAQIYHVTTDTKIPYYVYGNMQDGPSSRGPSNSRAGGIARGMWHSVGGGESGWATPDPENPDLIWSTASGFGSVGGIVSRYDVKTGIANSVEVWPMATFGWPAADLKYRFQWNFPLAISPHDHNKVYVGSQYVHVTTDGGRSWKAISPDLTRNDKSRQHPSGGLTPDNVGVEFSGVVFAIAESRLKAGLLWVGTNDGKVHLSEDGGGSWKDLTANLPGLLPWGTISNIEPSRFDASTAYLSVDGHQENNRDPWIYKTTDLGKTWKLIVNGIPKSPLSYVHQVKEDPVRRGLLYAGTENALYVSFDDGTSWQTLQNNLPHAPVHGINIQEHFSDLVLATYGRGMWILDDITSLRQLNPTIMASDAQLFTPRAAYRFRFVEAPRQPVYDPVAGQDPPYGASINYWLKAETKDTVALEILDGTGAVVRKLTPTKTAGINRVWWNLAFENSKQAKVRNSPLGSPEISIPPDGRNSPEVGTVAILAPPGTYTVRLTVGGKQSTQPLEVRKDPNSGGSEQEIAAQTALRKEIQADIESAVDMINTLESIRAQVSALKNTLGGDSTRASVKTAADSLAEKAVAVEEELTQLWISGRGQDLIRYPVRIAGRLVYLSNDIGGSDYAPTAAHRVVYAELKSQLVATRQKYDKFISGELVAFNSTLASKGVGGIVR
ncbi:MAG TPA: hypothetical protein VJU15_08270 [Gemmatimonadales bacterium]|nr:hypothetical protein [Gemmatimonadales bacterium]